MSNSSHTDERSLADLIRELRDESGVLLSQQVAMAKTEMSEKATLVGRNVGYLIVGAAVAFLAIIFLLLAVTGGLALMLMATELKMHAIWIAALIVGVIIAVIAAVWTTRAARKLAEISKTPAVAWTRRLTNWGNA